MHRNPLQRFHGAPLHHSVSSVGDGWMDGMVMIICVLRRLVDWKVHSAEMSMQIFRCVFEGAFWLFLKWCITGTLYGTKDDCPYKYMGAAIFSLCNYSGSGGMPEHTAASKALCSKHVTECRMV